jgi:hypothetical protein
MMRSKLFCFAALAFSVTIAASIAPANAQDDMRARGDKACNGDAKKLCSKFFGQGDMVILQCFQEHKTRLSSSCRKFLTEVGQLN